MQGLNGFGPPIVEQSITCGQFSPSNFSLSWDQEYCGQSDDRYDGKQKAVDTGEGLYSPRHFS